MLRDDTMKTEKLRMKQKSETDRNGQPKGCMYVGQSGKHYHRFRIYRHLVVGDIQNFGKSHKE